MEATVAGDARRRPARLARRHRVRARDERRRRPARDPGVDRRCAPATTGSSSRSRARAGRSQRLLRRPARRADRAWPRRTSRSPRTAPRASIADPLPGVGGRRRRRDPRRRGAAPRAPDLRDRRRGRLALDRRRGAGARRRRPCGAARPAAHRLTAVKLVTFLPPGATEPLARRGPRRSGRRLRRRLDRRRAPAQRRPRARRAERPTRWTASRCSRPHVPRAIFGIGLNYRAHAAEQGRELPETPIVFMKLPTSVAPPGGPVPLPAGRAAPGLRGRARRRDGRRTRRRRLRRRRRRQRPRPPAPRAAVDAREGLRRLLPVRPVGDDRRRDRRSGGPRAAHLGQRRAAPGRVARATSSSRFRS